MKKTILLAAAVAAAMTAGAQTFVTTTEDGFGFIPGLFTTDGQGRLELDGETGDDLTMQIQIRNGQLQTEGTFNIVGTRDSIIRYTERQNDDGTWEDPGWGRGYETTITLIGM